MGRNYFRNVDDPTSDPEMIAGRYQLGRNALFEISLTLAELADNARAASAGGTGSTVDDFSGGTFGGNRGFVGCPRVDQFVWVVKDRSPEPVKAEELLDMSKDWHLYNPLSRVRDPLVQVQLLKDQPLSRHVTERGAAAVCSHTHKAVCNTGDLKGTALNQLAPHGGEILSCWEEEQEDLLVMRLYQDALKQVNGHGRGDVVVISLEKEYIYMVGETTRCGTVAHNLKYPGDV